ncbi:conjugal transfer protein TraI [Mucilaginibacter aquaedulcis]|uniref:conjugal transfer protein TraI n=1 Tax=Mucilaginibacter aquaedulcis TaxID=1187081 RepID=UPI0025B4CB4E|nr:conjugal transfer protein TraI [Mucilaginibacter aquaedulcis]MDN3548971.1 conjugal transfer protein TraI [Mucilaginibacter aquaedulcis]
MLSRANGQIPGTGLVSGAIKKVIMAVDLKVQQLQNQTIALQNAGQRLENNLHLSGLDDISGWLNREKELYAGYYRELSEVRPLIADYEEVKTIITRQEQLVAEYRRASGMFSRDRHFSQAELRYMETIYQGILQESLRDLDQVLTAVSAYSTQMNDAERLQRIRETSQAMQVSLDHLRQFNRQTAALSLRRAKDVQDRQQVKQFYSIH